MVNSSLISVDWLQFFVALEKMPERWSLDTFTLEKRDYGSKLWKNIYKIYMKDADSISVEFGVLCCVPTSSAMKENAGSLKINNAILYNSNWHNFLREFVMQSGVILVNITRCDLAMDFIYLKNRVSGSKLVRNILDFKWWKCGRSSYSVYAEMPYSVKWARNADEMEYSLLSDETRRISPYTKTLTFGKMGSAAQVCIYDKTAELKESEIDGISAKEYIRDCHKLAGVYDEKRHTWRIEIRLSSKARTIYDAAKDKMRELIYADLLPGKIESTFRAAADVWFRLVDASKYVEGGKDIGKLKSAILHKSRMKVVDLLPEKTEKIEFKRLQKTVKPSRFYKAMASTCERLSSDIKKSKMACTSKYDSTILYFAARTLHALCVDAREQETTAAIYNPASMSTWDELIDNRFKWSFQSEFLQILKDKEENMKQDFMNEINSTVKNPILKQKLIDKYKGEPMMDPYDPLCPVDGPAKYGNKWIRRDNRCKYRPIRQKM